MKIIFFLILVSTMKLFSQDALPEDKISHRPPMVAGSFYPADPDSLRKMIDTMMIDRKAVDVSSREIIGMLAPHAGYVYSGKVAGKAYRALIGRKYDVAIIISPSHQKAFKGSCVFSGDAYVTPLGVVNVDKNLAAAIAGVHPLVKLGMDGHNWRGVTPEHAIEVQLPFLQVTIPGTPIVPIVMGSQDVNSTDALMRSIVYAVKNSGKKVLIIASSDLSHYHSADSASKMDGDGLKLLYKYDYFSYQLQSITGKVEACGTGPIVVMMTSIEQLGGASLFPVNYSHSGKTEAGKGNDRVVGYGSALVMKSDEYDDTPFFEGSDKEKILILAKETVVNTVMKKDKEEYSIQLVPYKLTMPNSAFVTIEKKGQLRACMGHTFPSDNLLNELKSAAKLAATSDYRFGPVKPEELDSLQYEVTILSRMKRVLDLDKVIIGKDGLLIRMGNNQGIFLPQVASERNWDIQTYLENLCYKAGLPKDAYLQPEAQLFSFRALVIHESDLEKK